MTCVKTLLIIYHLLNVLQQKQSLKPGNISQEPHRKVLNQLKIEPPLSNYKSHITKKIKSRLIAKHFIVSCTDTVDPSKHWRSILIDCVTNTVNSRKEEIDYLPLD